MNGIRDAPNGRADRLSEQTETTTACAYCAVGCNLTLHVQDNETVRVTSPHDNPVAQGNVCIKDRFGYQHVQNRD